jgi:hypothetical protein
MDVLRVADATTGPTLHASDVMQLRQAIRGELVLPDDSDYARARRVWNGMIDRTPAAIIYCAGPDDVIASVNFARTRNLVVAVRRRTQCGRFFGVRRRRRH